MFLHGEISKELEIPPKSPELLLSEYHAHYIPKQERDYQRYKHIQYFSGAVMFASLGAVAYFL